MLEIMWINIKVALPVTTVLHYEISAGGSLWLQHVVQGAQQSHPAGGDLPLSWYNTAWKLKLPQTSDC